MSTESKLSFYNSAKDVAPSKEITVREIVRMIREGDFSSRVSLVRSATSEVEKVAAKRQLPAVQISGHVTTGKRAQAMQEGRFVHSGWMQLDVDGNGLNGKTPEVARALLGKDPHVLSAFVSPSGKGAKALFRIHPCGTDEEHKAAFRASEKYILQRYDLAIDPAPKSPGSLCYLSADPDSTWQPMAEEFSPPTEKSPEPQKTPGNTSTEFPGPPKEEGVNEWLIHAARWCEMHGWSNSDTLTKLESYNGTLRRSFKDGEVQRAVCKVFDTPSPKAKPTPEMLRARAYEMRFNPDETPPPDETCMVIGDVPIAARGNLTVPQGKSKVGKSALISAILGAAHRGSYNAQGDTLCIAWLGESTGAIIHLDTEQSRSDWHALVCRGITRSGIHEASLRLVSLPLVMFSRSERLAILRATLEHEKQDKGSIDLVLIDGVADLCVSPNDEAGALELVSQLHALAQEFHCPVVCVLHENPSSSTDAPKTRGHLGSELNRKAFANLRIDKDTETNVSTIYGTDMRKRDIPKDQGFCFAWNNDAGMHTFQGRAAGLKAAQKEAEAIAKARAEWTLIFELSAGQRENIAVPALSPKEAAEIEREISGNEKLTKPDTMKKRMQKAESLGVLRKCDLLRWVLNDSGNGGKGAGK